METKKVDYQTLNEFRQELHDITLAYLKAKIPHVKQNSGIQSFIDELENNTEHELHTEVRNFQFIHAALAELQGFIKELDYTYDPGTRKYANEFLRETLISLKILSTNDGWSKIVRIKGKDYSIQGLNGKYSIFTLWLVEHPTNFAESLSEFYSKWVKIGIDNIIPELDPKKSRWAIDNDPKNKLLVISRDLTHPPISALRSEDDSPEKQLEKKEASESTVEKKKSKIEIKKETACESSDEAEVSENADDVGAGSNSVPFKLEDDEFSIEEDSDNAKTTSEPTVKNDTSKLREEAPAVVSHTPLNAESKEDHQVNHDELPEENSDEYTYEDFYVDEAEESENENSDVSSDSELGTVVADPHVQKKDSIIQKSTSTIKRTPVKTRYHNSDGESIEEEVYEESITEKDSSAPPTPNTLFAQASDFFDEVTVLRDQTQGLLDEMQVAINTPQSQKKTTDHTSGLSAVKNSAVRNRLRAQQERRSSFIQNIADNTPIVEPQSGDLTPLSKALADSEDHLKQQNNASSDNSQEDQSAEGYEGEDDSEEFSDEANQGVVRRLFK